MRTGHRHLFYGSHHKYWLQKTANRYFYCRSLWVDHYLYQDLYVDFRLYKTGTWGPAQLVHQMAAVVP